MHLRNSVAYAASTALALLLSACPAHPPRESEWRTLAWEGLDRTYRIFVPESLDPAVPAPLLIVLHGGGGRGSKPMEAIGFNDLARAEGFVVAYPEGVDGEWNDGRGVRFRGDDGAAAIDDVGFILAAIDAVAAEAAIDPARVYVTGASNGAMMTHRLAIEAPERFAAAAPVIGALPAPLLDGPLPALPVPMLIINGTDDPAVPFDGGYVFGREDLGEVASAEETLEFWHAANGCGAEPAAEALPDLDPRNPATVVRERFDCTGAPVERYIVEGGGHEWPFDPADLPRFLRRGASRELDAKGVIWAFFSAFER